MQVNTRHDYNRQLRDVLHIIATHPETEPCVSLILQTALQISGVISASFNSSVEPIFQLSLGDPPSLDAAQIAQLQAGENTVADHSVLAFPLRSGNETCGLMWIACETALGEAEQELLTALADGLIIVMTQARVHADNDQAQRLAFSLLGSITDPLLVFDDDWKLLLFNPAAEKVFGTQPIGTPLNAVVQSPDLIEFVAGKTPLAEWVSGDRTFAPRVQVVLDADNESDGWILALRDLTQFKKLNRNQNEFVRIVSHDLRSPLTSMQGFASMMGMVGDLNERQVQFVEKVLSGIAQITALVDNIQDAGRFDIETGFYEMTRSHCDLREMVSRIVTNHLVPAEKQELTISMVVADDVPILNADLNMLERALTNLVDNAIKYTPDGGKIEVNVFTKDESVVVSVKDNGLGISPEDQKQLFQRHVRLPRQEHKKIKGSGLGLFIVKSVAQRHGGDAWVVSGENEGSTFCFNIPLKGANLIIPGVD